MVQTETDYYGRVIGWKPIKKKPKLFINTPLGGRVCSKCGKLYMDTWSLYCCLDGKFLISIECLDFERRKLLGFDRPSRMNKELIVQE